MRTATLISAAAIALATTVGSVSAADQFATLDGVTANQMTSGELATVKGQHVHWRLTTPGGNGFVGIHAVGEPSAKGMAAENGVVPADDGLLQPGTFGVDRSPIITVL